ncbi:hypothetical protein JCM30566_19600 [Marinitoga arctica]
MNNEYLGNVYDENNNLEEYYKNKEKEIVPEFCLIDFAYGKLV